MIKKIIICGVLLIMFCFIGYNSVSTGFVNLDYLGQGKLQSVTVDGRGCITSFCEGTSPWVITVNNPKQLKGLESAFFNKIQDIFHHTKEDGSLSFIFHYEHKDIEFHASLSCDLSGGRIYYTDRQISYLFNKSEMNIFSEIFTLVCP
ncbi:MAG: hypothetical protein FD133_873 [Erysipelotrichaceae bacterium]|nr:MAG: hypothetical protein FD179_777 [Erysipelotrichaceae bacterium]MDP2843389.1 hypothetical protein [Acetobacterium sp.]TXT18377.1 MAG: hypothetical protein FD133_873 [Erysipelotrichaceae bacterium]